MASLFDGLLVSSPNERGGLFYIHNKWAYRLDDLSSTGLSIKDDHILRGIQPSYVVCYGYDDLCKFKSLPVTVGDIHDVLWIDDGFYAVCTARNEVIKFDEYGRIVDNWIYNGEKNSWHINCLTGWSGSVVFSAFGRFSDARGYTGKTKGAGFVQDLLDGRLIIDNLSQPHSLVSVNGHLLLANSELFELREYDENGLLLRSLAFDGYVRGICVADDVIYVGISSSRNVTNPKVDHAMIVAINSKTWGELDRIDLASKEVYSIVQLSTKEAIMAVLLNVVEQSRLQCVDKVNELHGQIAIMEREVGSRDKVIAEYQRQVMMMHDSWAWKATKPLRKITRWIHNKI